MGKITGRLWTKKNLGEKLGWFEEYIPLWLRKNVYNSGTIKDAKQCRIYLESTEQMWSVDVLTNIVGPLVLPQCPL